MKNINTMLLAALLCMATSNMVAVNYAGIGWKEYFTNEWLRSKKERIVHYNRKHSTVPGVETFTCEKILADGLDRLVDDEYIEAFIQCVDNFPEQETRLTIDRYWDQAHVRDIGTLQRKKYFSMYADNTWKLAVAILKSGRRLRVTPLIGRDLAEYQWQKAVYEVNPKPEGDRLKPLDCTQLIDRIPDYTDPTFEDRFPEHGKQIRQKIILQTQEDCALHALFVKAYEEAVAREQKTANN